MPLAARVRRRFRRLAALLAILVTLAACAPSASPNRPSTGIPSPTTGAAASAARSEAPTIVIPPARWADCGKGFQCAQIVVPLDYATGLGAINLSLVRLPATDQASRIGALLVNPGGPGASGVEFVRDNLEIFPKNLRRHFDLIGFDPRGVNESSGIRCIDNLDPRAELDPSPDTPAEVTALVKDAKDYAAACSRRNGGVLPFLSTDAVVRDLDSIRVSIGEEKINYLGFSYGTLIGALYADRYPDRVRAVALDGVLDPTLDLAGLRIGQARAFQTELNRFLSACAHRRNCLLGRGAAVRRGFDAVMHQIERHPLPSLRTRDPRKVGPGLAWSAIVGAMYSKDFWPTLEFALALAEHGDGSIFLAIADPFRGRKKNGSYSNMQDAYTANTCLDFAAPKQTSDFAALAKRLRPSAPDFASIFAYNDLPCAYWSAPPVRQPGPVSATGAPPIVLVGTTGDPATPYAWAKSVAQQIKGSVLLTHRGDGHTGYLSSGCVRDALIKYLVTLKTPAKGTVCD
jgi:pimeloyl-ACP methyl ester carboxylesterase